MRYDVKQWLRGKNFKYIDDIKKISVIIQLFLSFLKNKTFTFEKYFLYITRNQFIL